MSDPRIYEFIYQIDGGDLGDVDIEAKVSIDSWGRGEDWDCRAELFSARIGDEDWTDDLSNDLKEKIEQAACERWTDSLPAADAWKPGNYRWIDGVRKGTVVEVLGSAMLPGIVDWAVVTRERGSGILDESRIVIVSRSELTVYGDGGLPTGGTALVRVES